MTLFGKLNPDGTLTDTREIAQSDIMACPHFVLVAEHYRDDGSCRCDDKTDASMAEWGYSWDDETGRWT